MADPPGNGLNAIVQEAEILRGNYALFVDAIGESFRTDIMPGYSLLPLALEGETETYIGVVTEILEMLRTGGASIERAISIANDIASRAAPDVRAEFLADGTTLFAKGDSRLFTGEDMTVQDDVYAQDHTVDLDRLGMSHTNQAVAGEPAPEAAKLYLSY